MADSVTTTTTNQGDQPRPRERVSVPVILGGLLHRIRFLDVDDLPPGDGPPGEVWLNEDDGQGDFGPGVFILECLEPLKVQPASPRLPQPR